MDRIKPDITMKELDKIDVRVGTIRSVEDIPASDTLVLLIVDFGTFERTVIVGMKKERENPQEVAGKQALFVVNMTPKVMFGHTSHGMLFDIGYKDGITPVLAVPEKNVPSGTKAG